MRINENLGTQNLALKVYFLYIKSFKKYLIINNSGMYGNICMKMQFFKVKMKG